MEPARPPFRHKAEHVTREALSSRALPPFLETANPPVQNDALLACASVANPEGFRIA